MRTSQQSSHLGTCRCFDKGRPCTQFLNNNNDVLCIEIKFWNLELTDVCIPYYITSGAFHQYYSKALTAVVQELCSTSHFCGHGQNSTFVKHNPYKILTVFSMLYAICLELTSCVCHRKRVSVCFRI